ncbi:hypothetical protein AB6A40_005067 [Gnathostoma spinigerum]|uniref:Uncharacterized protein n=1 Tax=Gnathostoma spinigerum TaxID=75299 RepID=A0ABD6EN13_9BILA
MRAFDILIIFGLCSSLQSKPDNFGSLILCPPGGQAFAAAYMMACEMKRRRKRTPETVFEMRPATLSEIQTICCKVGCDLSDLISYCDPFGGFNTR